MKNNFFPGIFIAGLLLVTLLGSCRKSGTSGVSTPAVIIFNNTSAVDSVFDGDTYTLNGGVIGQGTVQSIQFYRSFPFNGGQDSVQMAATEIRDTTISDTLKFSVSIPDILYQTFIKVVVTQNGHQTMAAYTINAGRITNITTQLNHWCGGWYSNLYGNFYSIINDVSYGYSTETKHPELIPLCAFYFGDDVVGATDLDYPVHKSTIGFSDMGTRFTKTTFTTVQFDAMKSDDDFKSLPDPTLVSVTFQGGDIIFFKTKDGKKGLLKIISANDSWAAGLEDYNFDVKVQK